MFELKIIIDLIFIILAVYNVTDIIINSPIVIFSGLKSILTKIIKKILCFIFPNQNCQFLSSYLLNCYQCLSVYISAIFLLIYFIPYIGKFIIYVFGISFIVNFIAKYLNKNGGSKNEQ